jgi:hypothetical protein
MGIDGIGKKGPPTRPAQAPPGSVGGVSRPHEASRPFRVSEPSTDASPAEQAGAVAPARTALERLRAGEIDAQQYVDAKVGDATAHLQGLPAVELEAIRKALRERLTTDPALVDLVRGATGQVIPPSRDD